MGYTYSEHISDIGIRSDGASLEEAFEAGAEAMLNVMWGLDTIEESESRAINAEAGDIELLFVEVLNEVVSIQGLNEMALKRLECEGITKTGDRYVFTGKVYGERFAPGKHEVRTEVKGATYSGLSYEKEEGSHILSCVLDV